MTSPRIPTLREGLTRRETQILELLSCGQTNRQIAIALGVAVETVKFHLSHAVEKLGAENRTHAAVLFDRTRRTA